MALAASPGRTQDLTAACTHRIIRICGRQGVPILADLAHRAAALNLRRLIHLGLTRTDNTWALTPASA